MNRTGAPGVPPSARISASSVTVIGPVYRPPGWRPINGFTTISGALLLSRPPSASGAFSEVMTFEPTICSSPPRATWMPAVPASALPATPRAAPAATRVVPPKLLLPLSTAVPPTTSRPPLPLMAPRRKSWLPVLGPPVSCSVLSSTSALLTVPAPPLDSMRR